MPFQAAQIDPAAFRPANLAMAFQQGQMLRQNALEQQAAERELQDDAAFRQMMAEGANPNDDGFLAQVYKNAPTYAPQIAKAQRENAQAMQSQQKDFQERRQKLGTESATQIFTRMKSLPPDQRTPQAWEQAFNDSRDWIASFDPKVAQTMQFTPASIPHIEAIARSSGKLEYPEIEQDRKLDEKRRTTQIDDESWIKRRDYDNNLGPSNTDQWKQSNADAKAEAERRAKEHEQLNSDSDAYRKEFDALQPVKDLRAVLPIYRSMVEAQGIDNKAADLNLIYGIGKILDPNSVVREGELQLAADTGDLGDKIKGYYKSVTGGGRLDANIRKNLMEQAASRVKAMQSQYMKLRQDWNGVAGVRGLDASRIFMDPEMVNFDAPASGNTRQEGQRGVHNGRPVVYRGGKWVYQ